MNKIQIGFTVASLFLILYGVDRGFDISDEGVYALLAVPGQENIAGVFNYDLFFKLFYKLTGIEFGLIGLRILRLLTCFIAAGALTVFWNNFNQNQKNEEDLSVFLIALLGVLSSYGFLAQTLSYNSINLMCGCVWLGFISRHNLNYRSIILLGGILSILFYAKVTVCLILSFFTICFLLWSSDNRSWAKKLLLLSFPFLLLELFFFFSLGDSGVLRAFAAKNMLDFRPDYHFLTIVKYTFVGVFWSFLVIVPFVIAGYLKEIGNTYFKLVFAFSLIFLITIIYVTTITNEINHLILLSNLAVLGFLLGSLKVSKVDLHQWAFFLLLLTFPFILHFGSNVYFLRLGIHYWVFWLLALLFVVKSQNLDGKIIFQILLPLLTFLLVANGISLYNFNNYSYFEETMSLEYREDKFIQLPLNQATFHNDLKAETSTKDIHNILPIFRNPGLVYMLGKTHPKTPGIWSRQQLDYFFSSSENISVVLYNDIFEFPFEKENWREGNSFKFSENQYVKVFWKE